MKKNVIIDTGPLVALLNRKDHFHYWTLSTLESVQAPLLTCEPVITEACYLLDKGAPGLGTIQIMNLIKRQFIKISFNVTEQADRVKQLSKKYSDTPMDFADACIVRMSEIFTTSKIFTIDSDFRIYRKQDKKILSLLIPSEH
ncbi:MAG: PIN domain-containing protein [SAR324 cluster bacterium]|nr:PIN domain-containing protein [SAR324 cluster bacterium]